MRSTSTSLCPSRSTTARRRCEALACASLGPCRFGYLLPVVTIITVPIWSVAVGITRAAVVAAVRRICAISAI